MEPITTINAALAIARATGLSQWLGKKLGGDKGEQLASVVTGVAMAATGAKDPGEAVKAMQDDERMTAEVRMKLLDASRDLVAAMYADTANARDMQKAALDQQDVFSKRFAYYLASFWSLAAVLYVGAITFVEIPASSVRYADTALGFVLATIIATIVQFFFGSSVGSQTKTQILARLGEKP